MTDSAEYRAANDAVRSHFFKRVWQLTTPYWRSEEKGMAWLLLIVVIVLSLVGVGLNVWLNSWYRDFYNALQNKDLKSFIHLMLMFCGIAAVFILTAVYRLYLTQMLTIRWRRWLTERHFAAWLGDKNYYRLEQRGHTDNPDQRLSEDLNSFTDTTLTLGLGLIRNLVSLVSFSVILWGVSGSIELFGITIAGYMFWAALLYAAVGSWLTHLIARRLIGLNNRQQRYEADLRFGLVRVRENAESIALYNGEANENERLMTRFRNVWGNFWELMKVQKRLTFFSSGYAQVATVFPFIVAAPRYFSGQIQLGELMQINSAFGNVQDGLSWFIDAYASLANWRATCDRLLSFRSAMAETTHESANIDVRKTGGDLQLQHLSLCLSDGRELLEPSSLTVKTGEHLLIGGPSGGGKSTLLRAMSGLWRFGSGVVQMPDARCLFVPQKPYLPIGTLAQALSYPEQAGQYSAEHLAEVLRLCRLETLIPRLDDADHWQRVLSPGEQQRLAVARALLYAPSWLFLDEATSALDEADEAALYQVLLEQLPGVTLVSIGHRASLKRFHPRQLRLEERRLRETEAVLPA
ncbi:ABC transporter ATP-binding protein/permease [Pseudomonas sp. ZM23]|uniref:ABC transporter ATP-binding protein/permease n=1 Tax=Pseudomonas triclosanedens TaxID=2961893 RepID=A0ABY7A0E2_9PSED|nr:ABC transporter ATP-binding protein/permease [Pseudomonas triclosanedens]MCP8463787.1 ABC transporter ATP-binding protein/permease [Pseudomonas triclosanedens]MCP8468871.1 ABC transporter ATP-binding protein/permease [Pseudomonas triclosanedens]MCP8475593.1 ABC transporter ATP-binding protein/permease [Pseudomonas triclosanedens]WAI50689.1 ABC transporter ATP-binding protein/permease [Pseudomonas triclosanedens]